jgi:hypothetical protein
VSGQLHVPAALPPGKKGIEAFESDGKNVIYIIIYAFKFT